MIGPTGVGKTEISRRLAKLSQAPFVKVEASKFTEVGYVGRDVESIIRDLTEIAVNLVREEEKEKVRVRARELAEERLLDLLLPPVRMERRIQAVGGEAERAAPTADESATREKLRRMLREGKLEDRTVEIELTRPASPMIEVMTPQGMEEVEHGLRDLFQNIMPKKTKKTRMPVPEALDALAQEEATRLIDVEAATRDHGVAEIARIAAEVNERTENIGARRLHTVMERLLDQISFDAPEMGGRELTIDAAYVRERLEPILQDQDLSRFIL